LYQKGLDSDYYGIHGASVDAIVYLAQHGVMPINGSLDKRFYYYKNPAETVSHYARDNGLDFYVSNRLGINAFNQTYTFDQMIQYFPQLDFFLDNEIRPRNLNTEFTSWIALSSNKCFGVIVAVLPTIETDYCETDGDDKGHDYCIETENGLPLQYISGILPLGDYERYVLDRIKKYI